MEDIKSKYLSRKQIKYYYSNYPEVYSLLLRMISIEYHHISLENQIEKIAQAVRNKASYLERKKRRYMILGKLLSTFWSRYFIGGLFEKYDLGGE